MSIYNAVSVFILCSIYALLTHTLDKNKLSFVNVFLLLFFLLLVGVVCIKAAFGSLDGRIVMVFCYPLMGAVAAHKVKFGG